MTGDNGNDRRHWNMTGDSGTREETMDMFVCLFLFVWSCLSVLDYLLVCLILTVFVCFSLFVPLSGDTGT